MEQTSSIEKPNQTRSLVADLTEGEDGKIVGVADTRFWSSFASRRLTRGEGDGKEDTEMLVSMSCAHSKLSSPSSSTRTTLSNALRMGQQHKKQSSSPQQPPKTTATAATISPRSKRNLLMSILLNSTLYDTMESGEESGPDSKDLSTSYGSSSSSGSEDSSNGTIWVKSPDCKKPHLELSASPRSTSSSEASKGRSALIKRGNNTGSRSMDRRALSLVDPPGIVLGPPQTGLLNVATKPPPSVDISYGKIQRRDGLHTKKHEVNVPPNRSVPVETPTKQSKRESARSRAMKKSPDPILHYESTTPSKIRVRKTRSRRSKPVNDRRAYDGTTWVQSPDNSGKPHLELIVSANSLQDSIVDSRETLRLPIAPLL